MFMVDLCGKTVQMRPDPTIALVGVTLTESIAPMELLTGEQGLALSAAARASMTHVFISRGGSVTVFSDDTIFSISSFFPREIETF